MEADPKPLDKDRGWRGEREGGRDRGFTYETFADVSSIRGVQTLNNIDQQNQQLRNGRKAMK